MNERVLVGFARSLIESYCVAPSYYEFKGLYSSLYLRVRTPRVYHGLKRIWEELDERDLRMDEDRHRNLI